MKNFITTLFSALRFLTILPIPWYAERDGELYQDCVKYFPLVGLLIGSLGFLLCKVLSAFLPPLILSCLLLLYLSAISGFLHLDGFTDTADGFLSYRPKEKKLAIMRDSRTGAMGVIMLVLLLLFKFVAISSISIKQLPMVILLMPVAGRCAIILTMTFLSYARVENGLGKLFYSENKKAMLMIAMLTFLGVGFFTGYQLTLVGLMALLLTTLFFGLWCKKVIGGMTGDTLGAVCELTETTSVLFLAISLHI